MWPGQQPPGGEQNSQDSNPYANPQQTPPQQANPYQQPGYHQPNPYQQPGYDQAGYGQQQPNPYQQPPQPAPGGYPGPPAGPGYPQQQPNPASGQWGTPGTPPGAPQQPGGNRRRTTVIAISAAVAVVVAAGVTTALVLGKDDDGGKDQGKDGAKGASSAPPSVAPTSAAPSAPPTSAAPEDNPRSGDAVVKPVVPGWKTVVNNKRHDAFDVPADWQVKDADLLTGFGDDDGKALVTMSGPAYYKDGYCTITQEGGSKSTSALAGAGTKGAQGAKSEGQAAKIEAGNWVIAGFDQKQTGTIKVTDAKPFTSEHGLKGYTSSATDTGVKKTDKCTTDGKAFSVTYTDVNGDYATWVLYAAKNVPNEVSDATIKKIMATLRPLQPSS